MGILLPHPEQTNTGVPHWGRVFTTQRLKGEDSAGARRTVTLFFYRESSDLRLHDAAFTARLLLKKRQVLWTHLYPCITLFRN